MKVSRSSKAIRANIIKKTTKQEEELKEAVLAELLQIASDQLRSSLEIVKKIFSVKIAAGQPHKTPLGKVAIFEKRIASVGENP
jgi:hypothetical protein